MKNYIKPLRSESGMVLVLSMLIMSALILLGTTAVMESQTDLRIAANYKTNAAALYAAEAGVEEARARLKENFTPTASMIVDTAPTSSTWTAAMSSLQSTLSYTVSVSHKKDSSNNVLYWGDQNNDGKYEINTTTGQNIYLATSTATNASASKTLEVAMARLPPITAPAALYVEAATSIQGTSTYINGNDSCGSANKPGIVTTLATSTVTKSGNPSVCGSGTTTCNSTSWNVTGGATNMDVQAMVDNWKGVADSAYDRTSNSTETGLSWGLPVLSPHSCGESHVVYYNMHGYDLKLTGGTSGCGILLVQGDLEINGGFSWYGIVMVTGSVTFTGGGSASSGNDKNIAGSVLSGGSVEADLVGGNASIVYCGDAVNNQTANHPLRVLSWTTK